MLDLLREKIRTAQDKDVEDKKGTQPKRYYAKDAEGDEMSKSTKDKRASHFAKHGKKDDDDASAYKPAPGDKSAETKPSKYTKQYKKMFGEDAVSDIKAKHADEMEKLKARHEREIEALKGRQERQSDTAKSSVDAEKEREKQRKEVDTQSESIEEGKLVASAYNIIDALTSEFKKRVQKEYDRNPEKGIVMLNRMGALIGAKVSNKMQKDNKLFLKMDMVEETIEEKRLADILRDKEKSKQKAHQKAMMKTARGSIKKYQKGKKEETEVEEERDYKKEYANYHSQPEQIKRRAKRNEARRLMKDNKDIKGKDVHHKDNNPMNNDKKNLSVVTQNYNRKEPRLRNEVLDKNASQQDYIDDFLDSDAPQFKGKSKDKIIKMAVAAYKERNK